MQEVGLPWGWGWRSGKGVMAELAAALQEVTPLRAPFCGLLFLWREISLGMMHSHLDESLASEKFLETLQ